VIWLFERDGRRAQLQLLYLAPDQCELHFIDADGVAVVEHFTNVTDAGARQRELQKRLTEQGWSTEGEWKL